LESHPTAPVTADLLYALLRPVVKVRRLSPQRIPILVSKRVFPQCHEYLDPQVLRPLAGQLRLFTHAFLLDLNEEAMRRQDKRRMDDCVRGVVELMEQVTSLEEATEVNTVLFSLSMGARDSDFVMQDYERFALTFALKCFKSSVLEKRLAGLADIKDLINNALRRRERDLVASAAAADSQPAAAAAQSTSDTPLPAAQWATVECADQQPASNAITDGFSLSLSVCLL
jgi:hypothetical protein